MSIGDLTSMERGSGARANSGKPDLSLVPLRILVHQVWPRSDEWTAEQMAAFGSLSRLAAWQERQRGAILQSAWDILGPDAIAECANVFTYGKSKYAAWNWAKGMPWSVPLACAARHIVWGIMAGEELDPESDLPHRGHVACNIAMLLTYERTFPEGDDRAPAGWIG